MDINDIPHGHLAIIGGGQLRREHFRPIDELEAELKANPITASPRAPKSIADLDVGAIWKKRNALTVYAHHVRGVKVDTGE